MVEIKKSRTSTNFIFYVGYQILIYLIPFVVAPFLTRTLKEETLGLFTFSNSIVTYFVLLANLGIARYGQREIANKSNNEKETFWSLFFVHFISSLLSLCVFVILLFTVFKTQVNIYGICILYIVSALFDVTWLFYGRENFKIVTLVNALFSVAKMILVFSLIRNEGHLIIYQSLYYGAFLLSNLMIFLIALRHVGKPVLNWRLMIKHIKPLLFFSLIIIAVTLYTVFDKTIIGIFLDKTEVAYYEYADKIISIPKMLLLTIGTVLFPKMCSLQNDNEEERISKIHIVSLFFSIGIGVGAIFGLVAIGKPVLTLYYGGNFEKSGEYIVYMAPLVLLITLGDIFRTQFIIPQKKDKFFLLSVSINAVLNIVLSFALIKPLGVLGVIIGTLVAEGFGTLFQIWYCRSNTNFKKIIEYVLVFCVFGVIMFFAIKGLDVLIKIDEIIKIIILFSVGIIIYSAFFAGFLIFQKRRNWN